MYHLLYTKQSPNFFFLIFSKVGGGVVRHAIACSGHVKKRGGHHAMFPSC